MTSMKKPAQPRTGLFFKIVCYLGKKLAKSHKWVVYGLENIPAQGPVIIVPNHVSFLDPPVVIGALPRIAFSMAKAELFWPIAGLDMTVAEYWFAKLFGWMLPYLGAFPVLRGTADRNALRIAVDSLSRGQALVIFSEGGISHDKYLQLNKAGAAWLAHREKVPIIVMYIRGTGARWPGCAEYQGPIEVYIAEAIIPEVFPLTAKGEVREILVQRIESVMSELGAQAWG